MLQNQPAPELNRADATSAFSEPSDKFEIVVTGGDGGDGAVAVAGGGGGGVSNGTADSSERL
ncbi:hypothetical protein Hanom_Chr10g00882901 [Helianthus anomalus]